MLTRRQAIMLMGGAALLPSVASASVPAKLDFDELYAANALLAERPKALTGQPVEMTGFMAPPLKAEASFFVLTSMPMAVCPFCETEAQWPDNIVLVLTDAPVRGVPFNRPIRVTGTLETGFEEDAETGFVSLIRLVDAEYERL